MARTNWILKCALERSLRGIAATATIDELLHEVAKFISNLPNAERASLPPGFRPGRILSQDDLSHWAERLREPPVQGAAMGALGDLLEVASHHAQLLRPRRGRDYGALPGGIGP